MGHPRRQSDECFDKCIQAFVAAHPREKADCRKLWRRGCRCEPVEIDAVVNHDDLFGRQPQAFLHQRVVIPAGRDEPNHVRGTLPHQLPAALSIRLRQRIEERVFALQRADDWNAQFLAHAARDADEERIREANDIRLLLDQPGDEFVQLLCLVPVLAFDHRERHLAELAPGLSSRLFARPDAAAPANRGACRTTEACGERKRISAADRR